MLCSIPSSVINSLQILSHCTTIDQEILDRTKMDKVLLKMAKRGNEQGRAFAQKVLANAAVASKQKSVDSKHLQTFDNKDGTAKRATFGSKTASEPSTAGRKLQLSGDAGSQALKKGAAAYASASASASANGVVSNAKGGSLGAKKTSVTDSKASDKAASAATTAKIKTNVVVPKATSYFSSLQSASKKPGTSNAASKTAKSKDVKDGYVVKSVDLPSFRSERFF